MVRLAAIDPLFAPSQLAFRKNPILSVTITLVEIFMACIFLILCCTLRNVRYDSRGELTIIRSDMYTIKK